MSITTTIAAFAVAGIAAAFALAPRQQIETEIEIAASPQEVWAVLADGGRYKEWNPFMLGMAGELKQGARLSNVMQPEPGKTMTFRPVVLKAEPGRELRWLGRLVMPRLFDGEHYFVLEETAGGTRLVHGERFHGVLLWVMDARKFLANFQAMNRALKERVEAGGAEAAGV
ncbi:MAG: SRPBCC domain-containing protein [Rhizobiaceae bacterium]|nr:SRPBCC domain-containing protein [Rhizobiaceae bacterium]MCV0406540.1 SRPBCC domain-containing protein [Rhizobiaceae bacterium]